MTLSIHSTNIGTYVKIEAAMLYSLEASCWPRPHYTLSVRISKRAVLHCHHILWGKMWWHIQCRPESWPLRTTLTKNSISLNAVISLLSFLFNFPFDNLKSLEYWNSDTTILEYEMQRHLRFSRGRQALRTLSNKRWRAGRLYFIALKSQISNYSTLRYYYFLDHTIEWDKLLS